LERDEGLWQDIVRHKYLRNNSIHSVSHRLTNSAVWYDLLKVKDYYLFGRGICTKKMGVILDFGKTLGYIRNFILSGTGSF